MTHLIVHDPYTVQGKTCYLLNLKENHLPSLRKDISKELLGKEVEIFDVKCKITGIEMYAIGAECPHNEVGIRVEPVE